MTTRFLIVDFITRFFQLMNLSRFVVLRPWLYTLSLTPSVVGSFDVFYSFIVCFFFVQNIPIDDVAFRFLAMHFGIAYKRNFHKINHTAVILTKNSTLLGAPIDQNALRLS